MAVMQTIITILHIVIAVGLIVTVLFQQGKDAGLSGAIGGENSSESFFGKNKSKTKNAILGRITTILAVLFIVTSLLLSTVFTTGA